MPAIRLTRTHRILVGVVVAGAVVIAAIGFAGSYAAVRELAQNKGFGWFANVFPIGVDAGIVVLLALDLLLTWMRIPFPLLRQTAWLLTAATIAFNGAAAWPDPVGVGMHGIIPVLFVVCVEAARHAVGRVADLTADKHMESVRLTRWLLAPFPTFKLWRRMKLWELRSYDQVIRLEQDRLVYQARLQARYGRAWRRKAPIEALMPLRLARYGIPLAETAALGLAAAGITVQEPVPAQPPVPVPVAALALETVQPAARQEPQPEPQPEPRPEPRPELVPQPEPVPEPARTRIPAPAPEPVPEPAPGSDGRPMVPVSPGRVRTLANGYSSASVKSYAPDPEPETEAEPALHRPPHIEPDVPREEQYYGAFRRYVVEVNEFPNPRQFGRYLLENYGVTGRTGGPLSEGTLRRYLTEFESQYRTEWDSEQVP
ncbi:DUF2637 domain-containing protein [Streptomyces sp. RKAG337]|uniref:DUF2637 domain-containing protein n=1 Tax=Streptomyces sp. RKAG337 TaxID=2893404 RepID=UPI002033E804|nr:DUF2637 domain-containing protein [Streptomyces sp. RKAG337]MCM2426910.1 DUF2637 domain-containing protein [Streptomyces sp. RKAG337]